MFFLRLPDKFAPQQYGWERVDDFKGPAPHHPAFAMWRRKSTGPVGFEILTICAYDEETDALGGWFRPEPLPEVSSLRELWSLLRGDPEARDGMATR